MQFTGIKNWAQKTKQLVTKQPKKTIIAGAALLVIVLGVLLFVIIRGVSSNEVSSVKSPGGKITLNKVAPGMAVKNGFVLSGKASSQKNTTLYYIVSSHDKRALGAGNIATSKDSQDFSRNLTFDANNYRGKDGQLYVYLQDDKGKVIDGVTIKIKMQ